MRVAVLSLSSCLGCQYVLLSMEEYFYTFIGENAIPYAPFLLDQKELPEVDLLLLEGTVRHGDDFRRLREARQKADKLVALGTCACFGGVPGLADLLTEERMMRMRYGEGAVIEGAPQGVKRLLPVDAYVSVDAFLPGCPPPEDLLQGFLKLALSGTLPSRLGATVCSECGVTSPPRTREGLRRLLSSVPEAGKCLLEQGFICMGPLTRDGCNALCPSSYGVPCGGCRGPCDEALLPPFQDLKGETLRRMERATGERKEVLEREIKDTAHSFFRYCLAEPLLRRRRPGGTATLLRRLGGEGRR
ncbi:MAG: hypothetical protein H5T74_01840 [Actinobacteria bacterium]|nr:hypothetical protein [Actinomycetota bacterium]